MKIIITGATGFIGSMLVPLLDRPDIELMLVGRNPKAVEDKFPGMPACGYDELEQYATGGDLLLHLSAVNSDAQADAAQFEEANVQHAVATASAAARAGVKLFVHASSTHALKEGVTSNYASSKRRAKAMLDEITGIKVLTLYMPAVYGQRWPGRWKFLNRIPHRTSSTLGSMFAALIPTLHVAKLASFLMNEAPRLETNEYILTDGQENNWTYRFARRTIDLTFAVSVTVFLWWLMLILWLAVRLTSPGPGIFSQQRVGQHGRVFTCYKFRTMKLGTEQVATNRVSASAVTNVGQFLRKSKLDELPQVWNIFRNEISLIGPRPSLPTQVELLDERQRRGVLEMKPGITGHSQVLGIDMSDPRRLAEADANYRALQSLILDLKIIIRTAIGGGQGDRVAR